MSSTDDARLEAALVEAGLPVTASEGALRIEAEADLVGRLAQAAGIALTQLRGAEDAGLEELFLALTSAAQRDGVEGAA